MTFFMELTAGW